MNKKNIITISILVTIIVVLSIAMGVLLIKWEPKHVCDCNKTVDNKVDELVKIPYAKKTLSGGTTITEDVIGFVEVNSEYLASEDVDVIDDVNDLIGKKVKKEITIPEGGIFFTSQVEE